MNSDTINDLRTIAGNETGTLLANRYHVLRQLGQGSMGSVWLVADTQLDDKLFAVKMLPSILVANRRAYRQLKDEALVAMKLVHPNIVQIRAFEENNENPFLVMDYVEGETLDNCLGEWGTLSPAETVKILQPIAAALDYAHAQGVVHRDVKPANVMVRKDGQPFILDFGIAREVQDILTRVTGKVSSGTLLYMSPEQLCGEPPAKEQDVYSFAAMAYECVKGAPPFVRGDISDQVKNKVPEPLSVGTPLAASIMKGLAKRPADRPPSCLAVLTGGNTMPSGSMVESSHLGGVDGKKASSRHSMWKVIFTIISLFLIAVGGSLWYFLSHRSPMPKRSRDSAENTLHEKNEQKAFSSRDFELLRDNNEQLRNCIVDLSNYLESSNAAPVEVHAERIRFELPGEARDVDFEKDDELKEYRAQYETTGIACLNWGRSQLEQLCKPYFLDAEGNPQSDMANPAKFIMEGKGTAAELTRQIIWRAKNQKEWLKETRMTLKDLRTKYQELVEDYNRLPPVINKYLMTIKEKEEDIKNLEDEKKKVEADLENSKKEVEDLKADIENFKGKDEDVRNLKDEKAKIEADLENSKKEVEDLKADVEDYKGKLKDEQEKVELLTEECEAQKKKYDNLMEVYKRMQTSMPRMTTVKGPVVVGGQLTPGDKGKLVRVDNNKYKYVVVEFEQSALDELLGSDRNNPLPPHEMMVYRLVKDASGKETKKMIGRIRLRQWTPNTSYVVADILEDWQTEPFEKGDVVRTE